jgi:hypothetical protein
MCFKKIAHLATAILITNSLLIANAGAVSLEVKCEKRTNRSKISVDSKGLPNNVLYKAYVSSGSKPRVPAKNLQKSVLGEVEFDFDSDRGDIAQGATAIPANFIVNGKISAAIVRINANKTETPILGATANCRVR